MQLVRYIEVQEKQAFIDPKDNSLWFKTGPVDCFELPSFNYFCSHFDMDYEVVLVEIQILYRLSSHESFTRISNCFHL